MPVYLGHVRLPDNARLRLYKNENVTLKPLEYIDLCNSPKAGALYQVTLSAKSEKLTYLEACLRAYIDGAKEPQYISSGTEDYFLGTWYFNRGIYHNALGGLHAYKRKRWHVLRLQVPRGGPHLLPRRVFATCGATGRPNSGPGRTPKPGTRRRPCFTAMPGYTNGKFDYALFPGAAFERVTSATLSPP